ncbi:hypothetical protein [Oceanobacter sp. 4_MG-2023]|uniref:hypothetical protein n=1 Tax=Oceanobacter sp. 4_MG-2023 TaxID=3062623 RepID=UPI00273468B5|nr:hypothetical protein [Oceanobacter sp. 4_MG-2023]MDP2546757.1 hypothetical protein [Oceanobacter sp. 4_MG-2023]
MMLHDALLGLLGSIIVLILVVVAVMWLGQSWFIQWLKGTAGMLMLFGGFLLVYIALDLWSYKQAQPDVPELTVSVYETGDQVFDISLVDETDIEKRYILNGDQWQLDVRLLTWDGPFQALSAAPVYRLDRLSGRFLSLEQERTAERTLFELSSSGMIDSWNLVKDIGFWLQAEMGSAVFMPLVNGAVYAVYITPTGVVARPVNDVAEKALGGDW